MSIISEKFDLKITTLKNNYKTNSNVKHQGIKGGLNENELSSLIKEVIPQRYKIEKVIIENSKGAQSNETDILIYDDEILPAYIKNDLSFVPVEAVKYAFEVKSKLTAKEIKTTIDKFENYKSIGGSSPTVLFSFSSNTKGHELSRYKEQDTNFFTNPAVTVLCISNKSYYFKTTTEHRIKDYLSQSEFAEKLNQSKKFNMHEAKKTLSDLMSNNQALEKLNRSEFALLIMSHIQFNDLTRNFDNKKLTVNEIDYSQISFKTHQWLGIESPNNNIELSFLSGISNTLSKGNFGNYLLNEKEVEFKTFSICYEDMWGNISCQDFDDKGLNYNPNEAKFTFTSSKEKNIITFEINKLEHALQTEKQNPSQTS